ncbi:amylo-alpha-1,6-glucosidase [Homoserinibacter sp. GY 40078]|uniref:amylo-alpha-1,6-glucosidase n=1 Tax=Homoserinibacter sp. GY 40078 TaxID=2603275 RepID=UPI0011C86161|nr:glycogen debranching protein [Homoserinibacter sp. GY 40078]TXK19303.1 glycogen debranching protein [Homoserinibacter sp. GY 40078]
MTAFDLDQIPFSARGSWLSLSRVVGLHQRAELVHLVSHTTGMHPALAFSPLADGAAVEIEATPAALRWRSSAGVVEAAFDRADAVRVRGRGMRMRFDAAAPGLTPFTGHYLYVTPLDGSVVLTSYESGRRYRITPIEGTLAVTGAEALGKSPRFAQTDGPDWELAIEELESVGESYSSSRTFDEVVAARAAEFSAYAGRVVHDEHAPPAAELAAYVLWSATVAPVGFVGREAVLMSKHWMDKVWSWDHCFNALALARADPRAAIDQFLLPFDHQAADGALPDSVTHSEVLYNFVKPPIHGWVWSELRQRLPAELVAEVTGEVYARVAAWTRFWLDRRRAPGSALPFYEHGNDSGWDNATVFDVARVVESPDLAAFLVLQLDELARLAASVAPDEEPGWRAESARVLAAMLEELRDGDRLVARAVAGGGVASVTSLLTCLPILAADRLPTEVVEALVADIDAHLTEFGPATELVDSSEYESDGYWRGPIWAPSTYLIEQGLRAAGRLELADEVSARFRRLCERSGFAENFDALTGAGLRDRAYTWTAAVYLLFAERVARRY